MITELELTGYRSLNDFKADFKKLTIVIGANACGKSTLIDSVQLISDSMSFPITDTLNWHGGLRFLMNAFGQNSKIGWTITFNRSDLPDIWSEIPLKSRDHTYEVIIQPDSYGMPKISREILRQTELDPGYSDYFKLIDTSRGRPMVFSRASNEFVDFNKSAAAKDQNEKREKEDLKETTSGAEVEKISDAYRPEQSLLLSKMRFYSDFPDPSIIRLLLSTFETYPGFDVSKSSALRTKPAEIKPNTSLLRTGENLGTVLHEIFTRHNYKSTADDILDFVKSAYPFIEGIWAETSNTNPPAVSVRIHEKGMNRPMELWDLSDGCMRFLCLSTALLNPVPPPFIAIDEPEAGLHPRLMPIIADIIKTAAERTQVLVSTHSPDLLNCFELGDVAVMVREGDAVRWNRPGDRKSLRKMLETVQGEKIGDLHRSGELEAL